MSVKQRKPFRADVSYFGRKINMGIIEREKLFKSDRSNQNNNNNNNNNNNRNLRSCLCRRAPAMNAQLMLLNDKHLVAKEREKTYPGCFDVLPIGRYITCHSKISHLGNQATSHQNIPTSQVSMNALCVKRHQYRHYLD